MLGRNIKRALERQGISQRQFAKNIGITEVSLSRYVNDTRVPKATMLIKIANALGVTTEQLLSDEDNPYERLRLRISKFNYSTMLDEMIQTMCKEDRKEFLQYARIEIQKRLSRIAEGE